MNYYYSPNSSNAAVKCVCYQLSCSLAVSVMSWHVFQWLSFTHANLAKLWSSEQVQLNRAEYHIIHMHKPLTDSVCCFTDCTTLQTVVLKHLLLPRHGWIPFESHNESALKLPVPPAHFGQFPFGLLCCLDLILARVFCNRLDATISDSCSSSSSSSSSRVIFYANTPPAFTARAMSHRLLLLCCGWSDIARWELWVSGIDQLIRCLDWF